MMSNEKILVIGAGGQIGIELCLELARVYSPSQIIAGDIKTKPQLLEDIPYIKLDALDHFALTDWIHKEKVTQVYLLAAMLSATGEKYPDKAWDLNMNSLLHILQLAREGQIKKIFWPSSIAVFGPNTPRENTPQHTIIEPNTMYGITKFSGELLCQYYFEKYHIDVRSIRYPGLISYKSLPGGGTTDYAVDIYHQALKTGSYSCFLKENTTLPMMYMPDAIRATIELMESPMEKIRLRTSYNIAAMSFAPAEIALEIKKHIPDFSVSYAPDFRQQIAENWPASIDDQPAREDWQWAPHYDLTSMTTDMLHHLQVNAIGE